MHHHPVSVSLKLWGDILSECFSENPSYLGTSFKASLLKKSLLANLTFPHSLGFSFELSDQFLCVWDFEENIFWNILSVHIFFKKIIFRPFMRLREKISPTHESCNVVMSSTLSHDSIHDPFFFFNTLISSNTFNQFFSSSQDMQASILLLIYIPVPKNFGFAF